MTNTKSNSLKANAAFNILNQLIQIGVPILLIPILSGRLGTAGNGVYAYLHSIMQYFSYFALLGVNYFGTKTIAAKRTEGEDAAKKAFWQIFFAKGVTASFALLSYLLFCVFYPTNKEVIFSQSLFLLANLLDISWFFMGEENFRGLCIRNVSVKTITLIAVILLVRTPQDVWVYSLILGLGEVFNQGFLWAILIKKRIFVSFSRPTKADVISCIKGTVVYFVPQILIELYTIFNITFLGAYQEATGQGINQTGIFDYANKFVSVLTTVAVSLGMVFLARVSALKNQNKTSEIKEKIEGSLYYGLFISLPLVVGLIGTGHSVVGWFLDGEEWIPVGRLLFFLPLKALLVALSNTIGVQYLIPVGRLKHYLISVASGAAVCIVANLCLVPFFGAYGSCAAVLLAETCVTCVQIWFVRKEISVFSVVKRLWKALMACAIMGLSLGISYGLLYGRFHGFFLSFSSGKTALCLTDLWIIALATLSYLLTLLILSEKTVLILEKRILRGKKIAAISTGLVLLIAMTISASLYEPFVFSYSSFCTAKKRNGGLKIGADPLTLSTGFNPPDTTYELRTITYEDGEEMAKNAFRAQTQEAYQNIEESSKSYNFYSCAFRIEQCQQSGTSYHLSLRYALAKSEFVIANLERLHIFLGVRNIADESNSSFVIINNQKMELSKYFRDDFRSFLPVNEKTNVWEKSDFRFVSNPYYKDVCVVTFGFFLAQEDREIVAVDQRSMPSFKQELWFC